MRRVFYQPTRDLNILRRWMFVTAPVISATVLDGVVHTVLPAMAVMAEQPAGADGVRGRIAALAVTPWAPAYCASNAAIDAWIVGNAPEARRGDQRLPRLRPHRDVGGQPVSGAGADGRRPRRAHRPARGLAAGLLARAAVAAGAVDGSGGREAGRAGAVGPEAAIAYGLGPRRETCGGGRTRKA